MDAVYRLDFLCKSDIIVECKAVTELTSIHRSQLFNYLRLTKLSCGILVNFAPHFATIERYFYDKRNWGDTYREWKHCQKPIEKVVPVV